MAIELIYVCDNLYVALPVSGYIAQAKWTSHYTANWAIAVQIPMLDSMPRELKWLSVDGNLHGTSGTMYRCRELCDDTEVLCFNFGFSDTKALISCKDCRNRSKECPLNGVRIQGARPPPYRLLQRIPGGRHTPLTGPASGIRDAPYPEPPQNLGPTVAGDRFEAGVPVSTNPPSVSSVPSIHTMQPNRGQDLGRQGFAEGESSPVGCSSQLPSQDHGD